MYCNSSYHRRNAATLALYGGTVAHSTTPGQSPLHRVHDLTAAHTMEAASGATVLICSLFKERLETARDGVELGKKQRRHQLMVGDFCGIVVVERRYFRQFSNRMEPAPPVPFFQRKSRKKFSIR
jgi:hypothetical protein